MCRAPAKPVRACILRKWGPVSHVTFEAPLRTSYFSLHSSHSTLHASLHTSHFTALFALHTSLHTALLRLHTSHSTLHTAPFTPHFSHCTLHTSHLHLISSGSFSSLSMSCTKHVPVLLCTTKLAQGISQYYFVLQSLRKLLPSTDVYYRSLHKLLPSTTLYYKACTNYFAVLLFRV